MNKTLKLVLFVGSCSLVLIGYILFELRDVIWKDTPTASANQIESVPTELADVTQTDISTDEALVFSKEQDSTFVTMSMMTPDTWALAMGIEISEDEEASVSDNSAIDPSGANIAAANNETLGTSASQLLELAGRNNAIYTIYQIPNNVDSKISLNKFSLDNKIYKIPFSVDNFDLSPSSEINGIYNNSENYYFSSKAYTRKEYMYSKVAAYINVQVDATSNMSEAICFDYPHYVDDETYFDCYIAGIGVGIKRGQVEQYFGEGYSLSPSQICYKNDSGIIIVEYATSQVVYDLDEEGNEIATEIELEVPEGDLAVKRIYMFANIAPVESDEDSADKPSSKKKDKESTNEDNDSSEKKEES